MADTNKKNNFLDYEGLSLFWNNVKKVIEDNELVTATALTNLDTRVNTVEDFLSNQIISISYTDLKMLRDNAQLIPGQQYRITDYECTTSQENTKSAGHKFDIIVTADDEGTLNEDARAIATEENFLDGSYFVDDGDHCVYVGERIVDGVKVYFWKPVDGYDDDTYGYYSQLPIEELVKLSKEELFKTSFAWKDSDAPLMWGNFENATFSSYKIYPYFASSNLSAWKIWYCLDNDTTRFAWADGTNGKGVIYRMIDEFDNDIPYDFKNIQFKHPKDTTTYPHYYYTFASGNVEDNTDCSLNIACVCYSNTIKNTTLKGENINETPMILNQIIFIGNICFSNTFGYDCQTNSFGNFCGYNTFGNGCTGNTFGDGCIGNTFGDNFGSNTFGDNCTDNSFGDNFRSNTLGNNCQYNTFGNDYLNNTFGSNYRNNTFGSNYGNNTFGDDYQYNIFGNYYGNNTFGSSYSSNTFGNGISRNIVGNYCFYNTFGNDCVDNTVGDNLQSNTLGNECAEITFGNDCSYNTFGNYCYRIKFASGSSTSATKYNYYQYNHFGDGCREILFKGAETASASAQVQNYNFSQGLRSTAVGFLTVDGKRNRAFETKVARNSNGELKIYCDADLIQ